MADEKYLIAIAGPSGAGKTSLAHILADQLPPGQTVVFAADRYYRDLSHLSPDDREKVNFDEPEAIDHETLIRDLEALKRGETIDAPVYDFKTHTRKAERTRIEPTSQIIVEGLFLLTRPEYLDLFDLKVFASAPHDVCLERRTARDEKERDRTDEFVRNQYDRTVRPMCDRHIVPSAKHADLVVDASSAPGAAVDRIMDRILGGNGRHADRRERLSLIESLEGQYGGGGMHLRYLRKKYAWLLVTGGSRLIKRAIDMIGSGLGLLFLSPVFASIALTVKLTDGGPVFYVQTRVGKWGREFPFPKFRSMVMNADKLKDELLEDNEHGSEGVTFKMKDDPRITWIGKYLRRFSLDELPQLWSVFRGDMSLVGPRPPVPREVELYTIRDRRRLNITPGITCIWQISGRSEIPFPEQVELDVRYIQSQSVWLDLKILFQTVPAVLFGKGAY